MATTAPQNTAPATETSGITSPTTAHVSATTPAAPAAPAPAAEAPTHTSGTAVAPENPDLSNVGPAMEADVRCMPQDNQHMDRIDLTPSQQPDTDDDSALGDFSDTFVVLWETNFQCFLADILT